MRIHESDYRKLSDQDSESYNRCLEREKDHNNRQLKITKSLFQEYPKAARHYIQLFPNNYLDSLDLKDDVQLESNISDFENLLNSHECNERAILNHIRDEHSHFIVGSILSGYYNFGHHATHLFPEFCLGTSYKADYLLVGKNSSGWHFVFIEFEAVIGSVTKTDGNFGTTFRKGLDQIEDWRVWLDKNYSSLREEFQKSLSYNHQLPDEFLQYDTTRIHFVVVAGRRTDFGDNTYTKQRTLRNKQQTQILHYDNLIDCSRLLSYRKTY